jgi:hypothetical protein
MHLHGLLPARYRKRREIRVIAARYMKRRDTSNSTRTLGGGECV